MHIAMIAHSALLVLLGLSLSCQCASAQPSLTVKNSDGTCNCNFSLALNIPPCVCNGVAEVVEENKRLKEEIKGLVEASCFGEKQNSAMHIRVEGIRWTRFWWYNPANGWPTGETDVLGAPYGACRSNASHCFGRLPGALREHDTEILAIDFARTIYRWKFDPQNPTAHAAWNAFYHHLDQRVVNNRVWDPYVIAGPTPNVPQDSFMYRSQNGVKSVLLDDDSCDCYSTLSMGHGMCNTGFSTSFGPSGRFGVDLLYDTYCQTPDPKRGLALYFRDDDDCEDDPCSFGRRCVDKINSYICV